MPSIDEHAVEPDAGSGRQPYVVPRLASFGRLTELKSGESGRASENNQGGVKPRP